MFLVIFYSKQILFLLFSISTEKGDEEDAEIQVRMEKNKQKNEHIYCSHTATKLYFPLECQGGSMCEEP